jgi:hypothetical protein
MATSGFERWPSIDSQRGMQQLAMQRNISFFYPKQIEAMHAAFVAVCARLKLRAGTGDRATDLVAVKIVDLARSGECDVGRLTALTLAEFGVEDDASYSRH